MLKSTEMRWFFEGKIPINVTKILFVTRRNEPYKGKMVFQEDSNVGEREKMRRYVNKRRDLLRCRT